MIFRIFSESRHVIAVAIAGMSLLMIHPLAADKPIVDLGVAAEGRLVPGMGLVTVGASSQGGAAIVDELLVKAGDLVKQGDRIALLKGHTLASAEAKTAQKSVVVAKAAIETAKANANAAEASVSNASKQVTVVRKQLAQVQAGVLSAEKSKTKALADHDAAATALQGQVAEHQRVLDELDPPRRDKEELIVKQNMLRLEIDKLNGTRAQLVETLDAGIAEAQAAVAIVQAQVDAAQVAVESAKADAQTAANDVSRVIAEAELVEAQASAALLRARDSQIVAPITGRILAVNTLPGEVVGQSGIVYLGDTSNMYVEAQIYIDDIKRVKVGQPARVTGAALDGELTGKVAEVGRMVSPANVFNPDPTLFTDRRVVTVRVKMDDSAPVANLTYAQVTVKISTNAQSE
ncbi:HlyD family efflux transporter periplasmic adaptor subunit [Rubellicoccus peritrichatus]|uniref:HlyD family efflux transporter periplasmic adaptor subunit n=1 Tax=Rubellicoccus peritrichatus TaxID=3080537 RepID=A0AAQ3LB08_9BACT|nr:HlyD family efflux transporter periplasmic adaptor subunit [Puniceicoccus sp. CR14]WOO42530.1 HlyD family efflux transporter periplasmic adaptor subunit [Puniceicoccus sp. CR14]